MTTMLVVDYRLGRDKGRRDVFKVCNLFFFKLSKDV